MASRRLKTDYQVGIITALPMERASVRAMLDQEHPPPTDHKQHERDPNSYTWGSIGQYNIVMATLAAGVYGTTSATTTVLPMKYAFPSIKWGLMIGIGAGIPSHYRDIRLGDVAVSQPVGNSGGVFQYDLGKLMHDNEWKRSDWLARPPDVLLKALGSLQAEHEFTGTPKAQQYLREAFDRHQPWGKSFARPRVETDCLFEISYPHQSSSKGCAVCDPSNVIERPARELPDFRIHYGVIASGNSLVKNPKLREMILEMEEECICIEMEAAGLMNDFPCLVIRGICDYADSHKNDTWQRYASATAAAFAKELLVFSSEIELADTRQISYCQESPKTRSAVVEEPSDAKSNAAIVTDNPPMSSRLTLGKQQVDMSSQAGLILKTEELVASERQDALRYIRNVLDITNDQELSSCINQKKWHGGESLLHHVASAGDYAAVRVAIDNHAYVSARDDDGSTPLHYAVRNSRLKVAELLIDRGADITAKDLRDQTPLHYAAGKDMTDLAELLIRLGADINARNYQKCTPLHYCSSAGMERLLLAEGADGKAVDIHGRAAVRFET